MNQDLLIQLVGFVAMAASFLVFQTNRRSRMLVLQIFASILWSIHFLFLGALTGSAMGILGGVRNFVFYRVGKKRDVRIPLGISALFIMATALMWDGFISFLPLLGTLIATLALWQINTRQIRLIYWVSPLLWLGYNVFYSGSYAGITADLVMLTSVLIGVYRFDIKPTLKRTLRTASQKLR